MSRAFIVEADGGSRGNPGPAAYGAVVKDSATGAVLAELAGHIGLATNNVAEYRGALAGLAHAYELDPTAVVEIRLDSKLIVEQMSGRWKIKHPDMRELALQVRAVFQSGQVTYTWVPRSANAHADALVNEVLDQVQAGGEASIVRTYDSGLLVPDAADVIGDAEEAFARGAIARGERAPNRMVGWEEMDTPTTAVLVRHGATQFSLEKRFSGKGGADPGLAPIGEAQARAAAQELASRIQFDLVVSSPLLRTRQTAAILAGELAKDLVIMDDIAECAFGEWDGLTFEDVQTRWPDELRQWLDSVDFAPPGGESFTQVHARVAHARNELLYSYPGKNILVVSHVSPIKLMVALTIDAPVESVYRMELRPCSISTTTWYPDGNNSLYGFAESSHLRGVDTFPGV
ncbi:MAG: bifunctional RNase H/acid phosphatase [Actinomycetota bacterium]|nr:bifunctional RNase H/acid phosphatase [Actinomycetota bacterium]